MSYVVTNYEMRFTETESFHFTLPVPTLYSIITTHITTHITSVYSYVISSILSTHYVIAESSITTWLHPRANTYLTHWTYPINPPTTLATSIFTFVQTTLLPFSQVQFMTSKDIKKVIEETIRVMGKSEQIYD